MGMLGRDGLEACFRVLGVRLVPRASVQSGPFFRMLLPAWLESVPHLGFFPLPPSSSPPTPCMLQVDVLRRLACNTGRFVPAVRLHRQVLTIWRIVAMGQDSNWV